MKSFSRIILCFLIIGAFAISGCDKKEEEKNLPTVVTLDVTNIGAQVATGGGNVSDDGNASITARGVCWSNTAAPTLSNSHTIDASPGTGEFQNDMTGLAPGATYYARAYATNSEGTAYGDDKSFQTTL